MELPSICFIYPYIFISFYIILHIVIFFLIIKFIENIQKLAFLWGMINWTVAIGILYFGPILFINVNEEEKDSKLKIIKAIICGIIPPITEDVGRFIVFTFIYKSKNHNFNNSLIFGAGHGGWESIVLMALSQINNLGNFYDIKNSKNAEELKNKNLLKIYEKYKDGIAIDEIFGFIVRFFGNIFHMSASIIAYRLSLNRKEGKYIIFFTICFVFHFIIDTIGQLIDLFELSIWINLFFPGSVIILFAISYYIWKENKNKDFSDNELKKDKEDPILMESIY